MYHLNRYDAWLTIQSDTSIQAQKQEEMQERGKPTINPNQYSICYTY